MLFALQLSGTDEDIRMFMISERYLIQRLLIGQVLNGEQLDAKKRGGDKEGAYSPLCKDITAIFFNLPLLLNLLLSVLSKKLS